MKREKRDFLWLFGRTVLVRESAYEGLLRAGLEFRTGPAIIKSSRGQEARTDYQRVFQIRPVPCMAEETLEFAEYRTCPSCGISVKTWPTRVFLKRDSLPAALDIFAVAGIGKVKAFTNIIVTERFRHVVQDLGLTNMAFEDVELV